MATGEAVFCSDLQGEGTVASVLAIHGLPNVAVGVYGFQMSSTNWEVLSYNVLNFLNFYFLTNFLISSSSPFLISVISGEGVLLMGFQCVRHCCLSIPWQRRASFLLEDGSWACPYDRNPNFGTNRLPRDSSRWIFKDYFWRLE